MTNTLALPDVARATLPATYQHAKDALIACHRIDECKDWADKAAALASYAKQSDDATLYNLAVKIQARAVRRCGELLEQFQAQGRRTDRLSDGAGRKLTRREVAEAAGISPRQEVTAVRVANVPPEEFEALVESECPPTVTALADRGTEKRPVVQGVREATKLIGLLRSLALFCEKHQPNEVVVGVFDHEMPQIRRHIESIERWVLEFSSVIDHELEARQQ
jgi:hypothetical protein